MLHSYPRLGQEVLEERMASGLTVVVLPKPGFERTYATFATRYGGMDTTFVPPGASEPVETPAGIAHFLEHKMFEAADGVNILHRFSQLGASPNAYTGLFYTVYLVSAVTRFAEVFDLLLDYVQSPYFTEENVAKEQGIIRQEILMGDDSPGRVVHRNLMENLYLRHPVRNRVIGTEESVLAITPELLYTCHDTFYHPSNMVVAVAGDVSLDQILEQVEADTAQREYEAREPVERVIPAEPPQVLDEDVVETMQVGRHHVHMGFKAQPQADDGLNRSGIHRRLLAGELALEAVLGRHADRYWELYERGVITDRFFYGYQHYPGIGHAVIGGQTEQPQAFVAGINEALARVAAEGFDRDRFEEARRNAVGEMLATIDDPESLVHDLLAYRFLNLDYLERRQLLDEVKPAEGRDFLLDLLQADGRRVVSRIEPRQGGDVA